MSREHARLLWSLLTDEQRQKLTRCTRLLRLHNDATDTALRCARDRLHDARATG